MNAFREALTERGRPFVDLDNRLRFYVEVAQGHTVEIEADNHAPLLYISATDRGLGALPDRKLWGDSNPLLHR